MWLDASECAALVHPLGQGKAALVLPLRRGESLDLDILSRWASRKGRFRLIAQALASVGPSSDLVDGGF